MPNYRPLLLAVVIPLLDFFVSCQKEVDIEVSAPQITAQMETLSATRSSLSVDEEGNGVIYWTKTDEINVFYGTKSTHYVSQNTEDASSAVFKTSDSVSGEDLRSSSIWGLYPYDPAATCDGSSVLTTLPAEQSGVPESFDDDLFITLAHSNSTTLQFYNVCGGIKFSLSRDDISSVSFRGNNNEDIAGEISITFENDLPKATVVDGIKEITLTPKDGNAFVKGANYYIVTLPETLSQGFTVTFTTIDGLRGSFTYSGFGDDCGVTIKRAVFSKKSRIDAFATFTDDPQPHNVIYYTSSDGEIITPIDWETDVNLFGASIISNENIDGMGMITFDGEVTSIGKLAFQANTRLTSLRIPNSVTSIGDFAFLFCSNLTSIEIPASVISIGSYVFSACSRLASIIVLATTPPTIDSNAFKDPENCPIYVPSASLDDYKSAEGWSNYADRIFPIDYLQSNNVIYYSSSDGSVVTPNRTDGFGANIISNEYVDGRGIITFDGGVTSIGDAAFSDCSSLTSIEIPLTATIIGYDAFRYSGITSIEIPNSVRTIWPGAFSYCQQLNSVVLPNSITSLSSDVFSGCSSLTSIEIPNSVTSIGNSCFSWSGLTSIEIPDSIRSIGDKAFERCSSLASIRISNSVSSLNQTVFSYCYSVESIIVDSGNTFYDSRNDCNAIIETKSNTLIVGCKNTFIPDSVTSIGDNAFEVCHLSSITIPNSVTHIGDGAFGGCNNLVSIEIPNSVTSIGAGAFTSCIGLVSIQVSSGNPVYDSRDNCNAIIETSSNSLIFGCQNTRIPDSIQSIGDAAFSGCIYLTSIGIPDSVTSIGNYAFFGCRGLCSIDISNSVRIIGDYAFSGSGLATIEIPYSVTSIGDYAFYSSSLTFIEIPASIKSIGDYAFGSCMNLSSVVVDSSNPPTIGDFVFDRAFHCKIYVPEASLNAYKSANGWSAYADRIYPFSAQSNNVIYYTSSDGKTVVPYYPDDFGTSIISNEYVNGKGIISFDGDVTRIGESAFFSCTSMISIELPNSVTSIGEYAFGFSGLEYIRIPSSVKSIDSHAFYFTSGMAAISVDPDNPIYDSRNNCNAIIESSSNTLISGCKKTSIPNSITRIGNEAFVNCYLSTFKIPESVTSIGDCAFSNCGINSLTVLAITPPSMGKNVFSETNSFPIFVPAVSVDVYKSTDGWMDYSERIQAIPE